MVDNVKDFISFDMGTEVFASTNLPYGDGCMKSNFWSQHNSLLVDGGCSLGIFTFIRSLSFSGSTSFKVMSVSLTIVQF